MSHHHQLRISVCHNKNEIIDFFILPPNKKELREKRKKEKYLKEIMIQEEEQKKIENMKLKEWEEQFDREQKLKERKQILNNCNKI